MGKKVEKQLLVLVLHLLLATIAPNSFANHDVNLDESHGALEEPNCYTREAFQDHIVLTRSDSDTSIVFENATEECKFKRANRILQYCEIQSNAQLTRDLEQVPWNEESTLRVFLVPHSHNDAGWVHTFELYYSVYTKGILDRVLDNLVNYPELRFIWAEVAYFDLWWKDVDDEIRALVKKLVNTQQLEFVSGGWIMPDEASVHYLPFLLQLIEGHQWLHHNFNSTPKNGWEIDPFGLSQSFSHLRKLSGMQNTVVTRMNYQMKNYLAERKSLEFNWKQQWCRDNISKNDSLFTHILPFSYDTSHACGPDDKICVEFNEGLLGEKLTNPNVTSNSTFEEKTMKLLKQFRKQSMLYQTKNLLIPIGGDFKWNSDYEWAQGMDYLRSVINFINSQDNFNTELQISNLEDYFTAVKNDISALNLTVKSLTGDLFPYADVGEDFWSGYFTSRIFHKVTERHLMAQVRTAQLLYSLMTAEISKMGKSLEQYFIKDLLSTIVESRRSLALFQHHDAIAGTSTDDVVLHTSRRLHQALENCQHVIQLCLHFLTRLSSFQTDELHLGAISGNDSFLEPVAFRASHDDLWRHKMLDIGKENTEVIISVFNSLSESRAQLIRLNVSDPNVLVFTTGSHVKEMPSEILPVLEHDNQTQELVARDNKFELTFLANFGALETLSFKIIYAERSKHEGKQAISPSNDVLPDFQKENLEVNYLENLGPISQIKLKVFNCEGFDTSAKFRETFHFWDNSSLVSGTSEIKISNEIFSLSFNSSGNLNSVLMNGETIPVELTFQYYSTYSSGLYLFRPNRAVTTIVTSKSPTIIVVEGRFQSYVQVYYDTLVHRVTLLSHFGLESSAIHIENLIDISHKENYELIMRLDTKIDSNDIFYTDSNGFQMMKRKRLPDLPAQGNYYPVATSAFLEDDSLRMSLLTAQPGGATSLKSGQLEIMLDRIVNQDDSRGAGQGGKDNLPVVTNFKILFEKPKCEATPATMPMLSLPAHHQLNQLLFPLDVYVQYEKSDSPLKYSISNTEPTPCDIHLLGTVILPKPNSEGTSFTLQNTSGILIHRVGYDNRFDSTALVLTCNRNSSGELNFRKLFGELFEDTMKRMSLTFTQVEGVFSGRDNYPIKPMSVVSVLGNYHRIN